MSKKEASAGGSASLSLCQRSRASDAPGDRFARTRSALADHVRNLPALSALKTYSLISNQSEGGMDNVYFDVKRLCWLADAITGARRRGEFKGARIFFPEERWEEFNKEPRALAGGGTEDAKTVC
jgi:hypothetical protein